MECLLPLILLALAVGVPSLLGWMGRTSKLARGLLRPVIAASTGIAVWQFQKLPEIDRCMEQRVTYSLPVDKAGLHSISILPLPGKGVDGIHVSAVRAGEGPPLTPELMKSLEWRVVGKEHVTVFPPACGSEGDGIPLLESIHFRGLDHPVVLEFEVRAESAVLLKGLELRVRPNGCSLMDLSIFRFIAFWTGMLGALASAIGLGFLVFGRLPPVAGSPGIS